MKSLESILIKDKSSKIRSILQKPEYVFLILISVFGFIMVFLMPVFMNPDELGHFGRAYQVGEGKFVSESTKTATGGEVPTIIEDGIGPLFQGSSSNDIAVKPYLAYLGENINTKDVTFATFNNEAVYSPLNYVPQAVGIDIARIVHPTPGTMVFLGRLFNLATYILLIFLAIKLVHKAKWVYVVVGLFPMAVQQAASLSSDAMTIALALLWIAYIQNLFLQQTPIIKKQWIIGALLAAGLALTKQANVVLLLPVLFVPGRLFVNKLSKVKYVLLLAVIAVICAGGWYLLMVASHSPFNLSPDPLVNQSLQLKWVLHNPLSYVEVLFRTYIYAGHALQDLPAALITSAYGTFSFLYYSLPLAITISGYILLIITLLYGGDDDKKHKSLSSLAIVQIVTVILSAIVIATLEYLTYTEVANKQVTGLQGRYFILLIPLVVPLFLVIQKRIRITVRKPYHMGILVFVVSFVSLISMVLLTYKWFY